MRFRDLSCWLPQKAPLIRVSGWWGGMGWGRGKEQRGWVMSFAEGRDCRPYWLLAAPQIWAYRLLSDHCNQLCFGNTKTTHISTKIIVDGKHKHKITVYFFHSNNAPASVDSWWTQNARGWLGQKYGTSSRSFFTLPHPLTPYHPENPY